MGCHKTALVFVDAIFEILGPLGKGVPLLVAPPDARMDPALLVSVLACYGVTRLILVPSLLRVLLALTNIDEDDGYASGEDGHGGEGGCGSMDSHIAMCASAASKSAACGDRVRPDAGKYGKLGALLPRLKYWTTSGEALTYDLMEAFFRSHPTAALLNLYGSTECAADITWADFRAAPESTGGEAGRRARATSSIVPIGHAITGCGFLVLDPETLVEVAEVAVPSSVSPLSGATEVGRTAEDSGVGEIFVFGPNLAEGYFDRPDLTSAAFVILRPVMIKSNDSGALAPRCFEMLSPWNKIDTDCICCFRTGDFGYVQADDKSLCYVGRRDQQVRCFAFSYFLSFLFARYVYVATQLEQCRGLLVDP